MRKVRHAIVFLLAAVTLPLAALDAPPAGNLIPELNFQNPAGWSLGCEGTIQSVGGKFGDQVLEIRRNDASLYQPVSYQLNRKQLKNNTVYTFGAWVQGSKDSNPSLAVEFHDRTGKYLSGVYLGDHTRLNRAEWNGVRKLHRELADNSTGDCIHIAGASRLFGSQSRNHHSGRQTRRCA